MSLKALFYAYVLGGLTLVPLLIAAAIFWTIYTSVPVGDPDIDKRRKRDLQRQDGSESESELADPSAPAVATAPPDVTEPPRPRKGWLIVRRTFEESPSEATYVGMVRGFLDARSKDPKRSRPKDTWYVALKGTVLYLYEDESMTDCEAAIELGGHEVVVYPEGLQDAELFAKRNAICLKPKVPADAGGGGKAPMPSVTKEMRLAGENVEEAVEEKEGAKAKRRERERERLAELERRKDEARSEALDVSTPWFIFVRSAVEMEDWYLALVHASDHPANTPPLAPLEPVYQPADVAHLVATLDEQPDVIPMRWLNALLGRVFFSYYRTQTLESYIIGRLMKKISKVKRPAFLTDIAVREVSVGNRAPTLSKPMLKELTKEGDAALEVHLAYKGEVRVTVEATATINLGARFRTYTVKLVLAIVLREIEGNLLIKVKRPPSSRIWYAFTQMPRLVLDVEPVVSDRQITWGMILSTIESKLKEVILESVVLPNMDDISFFESNQYDHRGGIWADAARHEKSTALYPEEEPITPTPDETASTASAPLPEAPTPVDVAPIPRSHSAEEVERTSSSPPEVGHVPRPATFNDVTPSSSSTPTAWLSETRPDSEPPVLAARNESDDPVVRGRKGDIDPAANRRSSWAPNSTQLSQLFNDGSRRPDSQHLTPTTPRSKSQQSQHSQSGSVSSDISDDGGEGQMATYSKSPGATSATSLRGNQPTSPGSFLQTLRSRAGDKQALSNTAKEAMRKWGVNWGGLRRENGGGSGSNMEELPDAGSSDNRRQDSRPGGRPSYAEVRAAVEERRGRAVSPSPPSGSEPIPIPPNQKGMAREDSASSGQPLLGASSSNAPPSTSQRSTPNAVPSSSASLVPPPLERTTSRVSSTSREPATPISDILPDEPERPPSPVRTQPPAPKAMIIPGIHASHRGNVMSMGYAPPPPPPPEQKKAVTIQGLTSLWKKNTNPSPSPAPAITQPSDLGTVSNPQSSDQHAVDTPSEGGTPANAQPPDKPLPPPRSNPPPLPPRTNPTHPLYAAKAELALPSEADPSASPASAALQSIVSKDRSKRASLSPPATPGQGDSATQTGDVTPGGESPPSASAAPARTPPALPPRKARTNSIVQ